MTRYVTLPIVAVGAVATHMALDFEAAFTKIAASSNASAADIAKWKEQVKGLAVATGRDPAELADALYYLASAGLKTSQVMEVLEASARGAAAGYGTTAEIAKLTANVLNAYAGSGIKAAEVTDTLAAAVKEGTADTSEFAGAMGKILPIASKAGVGFDEVAASLAALSNIGLDVDEGVTAMRGVLMALEAPGSAAADMLKKVGISADEMRAAISEQGLLGALRLLEDATKGNIDQMRVIVPNVRALTGVFGLTGQEAEKVSGIFDRVADSTGDMSKAFAETKAGPAFAFQQALTQLKVAAIDLGQMIIPILVNDVIPAIKSAIKWFTDLSPATKELALKLLFFAAVAGPLLRVAGALFKVGGALLTFGGAMAGTKIATGLAGIGTAAGTAAGAGGIAGLGAAALAVTPWLLALAAAGIILAGALGLLPSVSDKVVGGLQEVSGDETLLGKMAVKAALQADGLRGVMNLLAGSTTKLGSGIAGDLHLIDQYGIELNDAQKFTLKQYLATGNLRGALDLLNRIVKDSVDPIAKHADAEKRAADEADTWGHKSDFAAGMQGKLNTTARRGRSPTDAFAGAAQSVVTQLKDWATAAYQAWLNQVKLNTAVSNWHPPTTTWAPPGGGKQGRPLTPRVLESLIPVTVPLVTERVGRASPLNVNVRLERRQFARGLDAEYAGRGW